MTTPLPISRLSCALRTDHNHSGASNITMPLPIFSVFSHIPYRSQPKSDVSNEIPVKDTSNGIRGRRGGGGRGRGSGGRGRSGRRGRRGGRGGGGLPDLFRSRQHRGNQRPRDVKSGVGAPHRPSVLSHLLQSLAIRQQVADLVGDLNRIFAVQTEVVVCHVRHVTSFLKWRLRGEIKPRAGQGGRAEGGGEGWE